MLKKLTKRRKFEPLSKKKELSFTETEYTELENDALNDPEFDSLSDYIRWLLRTHPDRPKNKKK